MIRAAVSGLGELLITVGLLLLLFVTWQLWWTDVVAGAEQQQIATDLRDSWSDERPAVVAGGQEPAPTDIPPMTDPPAMTAPSPRVGVRARPHPPVR